MHGLGVESTQPIAEALYVGLVTDTGRFMYENTGPRAHEMAAELIAGGVDAHAIYRRLYEGIPQGKLELLARGLTNVERFDGGLLTLDAPDARRLPAVAAPTRATPRASSTTCARSRAPRSPGSCASSWPRARRRARCRCGPPTTASTCRGSRARAAAAGTAARPASPPTSSSRSSSSSCAQQVAEQLWPARGRRPARRQAGGGDVARRRRAGAARARRRQGRPRGDAGPVRDRAAARAGRPRDARPAVPDGAAEALRDGRAAGLDVDDRRPRGRARAGRDAVASCVLPTGRITQRPPAYSAIKIGGKRAYALARAGETVEMPEREVEVTRFELLWREDDRAAFAIECSSGTYVRSLIADLGDAYCVELRRTAIGPFEVADDGALRGARRRARVPARGRADRRRRPPRCTRRCSPRTRGFLCPPARRRTA